MNIFISWSGKLSQTAASEFHNLLKANFYSKHVRAFFSPEGIAPGSLWRDIIRATLTNHDIGIFFLTRESLRSPWVLFEAGAIGKLPKAQIFIVLIDITYRDLPSPFEQYQSTQSEKEELWKLVKTVNNKINNTTPKKLALMTLRNHYETWWKSFRIKIDKVKNLTFSAAGDWSLVADCFLAQRISGSPFQAKDLFRIAKHRLDFVAQNHYYMTVDKEKEHKDLLEEFLSQKDRKVQILAMDPNIRFAVKAWTELMSPHFPKDLRCSINTLRHWKNLCRNKHWPGKLDIRITGLVPTSQSFFDAELPGGGLVMVPMINKPSNIDRPVFVITKKNNPTAFESYWTAYFERFRRARRLV